MKLIVGLGNPGKEYENTRHNVGFMVIDNYLNEVVYKSKFNGLYYKARIQGEDVIFLKPQSYMNLSGIVVKKYIDYFKIDLRDVLVIRDDLDIKLGSSKIKIASNSGGDNGIKSIIYELGTNEFGQYKIGISNDKNQQTKDYVLGEFTPLEKQILETQINQSTEIIDYFIKNDIDKTICKYNGKLKWNL